MVVAEQCGEVRVGRVINAADIEIVQRGISRTTYLGGASDFGTVFKLDTTGTETVLHSFTGGADGAILYGGLVRDKAGNLYGTTSNGGASGVGTVFKITP